MCYYMKQMLRVTLVGKEQLSVCHCVRSNAAPESPSLCEVHVDKGELLQSAMKSAERLKFPYKSCRNVVHHVHRSRKGNKGPVHANL